MPGSSGLRVAVVGATGAVGRELFCILEDRRFPAAELIPFASERSVGKELRFAGKPVVCQPLKPGCFQGIDVVFFDASDAVSKQWVPEAAQAGAWVIDNSAAFRLDDDVPLLVPEVNGHLLDQAISRAKTSPRGRILAGPNCSTVQLVVALQPLQKRFGLRRVIAATYQSSSGAGTAAMDELRAQAKAYLAGEPISPRAFTHQIAFNCIPHIGGFQDDGSTSEERKIRLESRKILGLPELRISATAVRVPTLLCHGEAVSVELERACSPAEAREAMRAQAGIEIIDDPSKNAYPMGLTSKGDIVPSGSGADPVYVGRIRRDPAFDDYGVAFWIISDNLRKGAALNAVQIGEALLAKLGR
jgi:aspartate-semialdehyde dehydrogenase